MSGRMCRTLVVLSFSLSVFCLEGAAQSVGRKGKRAANWSAFRASPNFLHILCAVFHAKWNHLKVFVWPACPTPLSLLCPTQAAVKGSSIIREQTIKQNGFLFRFYIHTYKFLFFFFLLFIHKICLTIKGMSWSVWLGREWRGGEEGGGATAADDALPN